MLEYRDCVVLVTGGTNGIGKATVETFAALGAHVINADVDTHEHWNCANENIVTEFCDVGDFGYVDVLFQHITRKYNRLDVLINNAGQLGLQKPIGTYDPLVWQQVINTNLIGAFACTHYALKLMALSGHGTIINVSSPAGESISDYKISAYYASKFGVNALTMATGHEYPQLRVMAIAPTCVNTAIQTQLCNGIDNSAIDPAEIAKVIRYLALRDDTISGKIFNADEIHTISDLLKDEK